MAYESQFITPSLFLRRIKPEQLLQDWRSSVLNSQCAFRTITSSHCSSSQKATQKCGDSSLFQAWTICQTVLYTQQYHIISMLITESAQNQLNYEALWLNLDLNSAETENNTENLFVQVSIFQLHQRQAKVYTHLCEKCSMKYLTLIQMQSRRNRIFARPFPVRALHYLERDDNCKLLDGLKM